MNKENQNPLTGLPVIEVDSECTDQVNPSTRKIINKKSSMIRKVGTIVAGAALADMVLDNAADASADTMNQDETSDIPSIQQWDPHHAPMASAGTVNDNMSFEEAFSAAREELGAGGVFSWQGEYYNTFYSDEIGADNQPVVEYSTTEHHDLPQVEDYNTDDNINQEADINIQDVDSDIEPNVLEVDTNADGVIDAVLIDINLDGSADAIVSDINQDSVFAEDEITFIHDPETLVLAETPADPSMMAVDTDGDQIDDVLIADVDGDQVADLLGTDSNRDQVIDDSEVTFLNDEAMQSMSSQEEVEYSGEIAADMPDDVTAEVLDSMDDDLANLEDNFDNLNEWA